VIVHGVQNAFVPTENETCTEDLVMALARVRLPEPVDGRAIVGASWGNGIRPLWGFPSRPARDRSHPRYRLALVPNLIGLRVQDAVRMLTNDGFDARITRAGGQVVREQPAPGQVPTGESGANPDTGVVTITAGPRARARTPALAGKRAS